MQTALKMRKRRSRGDLLYDIFLQHSADGHVGDVLQVPSPALEAYKEVWTSEEITINAVA